MGKWETAWFWLCSAVFIPAEIKLALLEAAGGVEALFGLSEAGRKEVFLKAVPDRKTERIRNCLYEAGREAEAKRGLEQMKRRGIRLVTWEDPDYPARLRNLPDAPAGLFVRGSLPGNGPAAAIVGARNCSYYGASMARNLGQVLTEAGIQVISGLAKGIDAAAHEGALLGCRETGLVFGVLGCGIDVVYPAQNRKLYEAVAACGGILSEYPPGLRPFAANFPARNRIISGLSDGVTVVEADTRSGSLITASCALEQGKEIWAVPGRVGDRLSRGTNELIRDGAGILTEPEDMLRFWARSQKNLNFYEEKKILLDKKWERVYSCLDSEPKSASQLCEETGLEMKELARCLVDLVMEGLAAEPSPHYYAVKRHKGEHYGKVSGHRGVPCESKDH